MKSQATKKLNITHRAASVHKNTAFVRETKNSTAPTSNTDFHSEFA